MTVSTYTANRILEKRLAGLERGTIDDLLARAKFMCDFYGERLDPVIEPNAKQLTYDNQGE